MTDMLYDEDFVTWTERQAAALRAAAREGSNLPIDWENLAEEIEDVGSEVLHQIEGLTRRILINMLQLACSPSDPNRAGWQGEMDESRVQLARRLETNHAIRSRFDSIVDRKFRDAVKAASRAFRRHGEEESALPLLKRWRERGITAAEVREDGLFPEPGTLAFRQEP